MILEYPEFRQLFNFPPMIDLDTFKQSVKVKRNQKIMPYTLDEFITRMGGFRADHREQYWSNLYDICVTNREKTLREWYDNNISINDIDNKMFFELNTDILSAGDIINASKQNKSRIIKNINFTGVYGTQKYNRSDNMMLLSELHAMFNEYIINSNFTVGKQFNIVLRYDLKGLFALMRGTRHKASIFNPYTYGWMLQNLFTGTKVLAPTAGWNSYQIGFHQTKWKEFTCIDVIPSVIDNTKKIANYYESKDPMGMDIKTVKGYCCPSEKVVMDEPNDYYDLILFGPPYYKLELYDGDNPNQSSNSYPEYEDWLEGYWDGTVRNMLPYLKKGSPFAFCIGNFKNVFGEEGKEKYNEIDISKDMLDIAKRYLTFDREYTLGWGSFTTSKGKANDNKEHLYIMRKT